MPTGGEEIEAGRAADEAEVGRLVLTHLRASRHAAPEELATEAANTFGGRLLRRATSTPSTSEGIATVL